MPAENGGDDEEPFLTGWYRIVAEWHDFYALMGTAGATLVGLTFVVITLSPQTLARRQEDGEDPVRAYTTPIVAFFTTILLVSVLMMVPRLSAMLHAAALAIIGLVGVCYMCSTGTFQSWRKSELGFDDLLWYVAWPQLAYIGLLVAAILLWRGYELGLYFAAGANVFFLLIGMRNAWDVVLAVARMSAGGKP